MTHDLYMDVHRLVTPEEDSCSKRKGSAQAFKLDIHAQILKSILDNFTKMKPEDVTTDEWAEWYLLSPEERLALSMKLRSRYLAMGGSLEPETDLQCPFYSREEWAEFAQRAKKDPDSRLIAIESLSGL